VLLGMLRDTGGSEEPPPDEADTAALEEGPTAEIVVVAGAPSLGAWPSGAWGEVASDGEESNIVDVDARLLMVGRSRNNGRRPLSAQVSDIQGRY
jgi:hypothetical protein